MKTSARAKCTHPGCTETAFWSFGTRKEAAAHYKYREKWKCTRHTHPEEVLSTTNLERTVILTAQRSDKLDPAKHRFWHNGIRLASGFNHSDAHKAYATDFPEGTRLIITARIELPTGGGGAEHGGENGESKSGARSHTAKLSD
jgi:hypothetical protein